MQAFRTMLATGLISFASVALADGDFTTMNGAEIRAALTGKVLNYSGRHDGRWQVFSEGGETLYFDGRESRGTWRVQADQYCSLWAPGGGWACYDMETDGTVLRFIGRAGDVYEGVIE